MPTWLAFAWTRDAITWRTYLAFRLPFGVTVAFGREWR